MEQKKRGRKKEKPFWVATPFVWQRAGRSVLPAPASPHASHGRILEESRPKSWAFSVRFDLPPPPPSNVPPFPSSDLKKKRRKKQTHLTAKWESWCHQQPKSLQGQSRERQSVETVKAGCTNQKLRHWRSRSSIKSHYCFDVCFLFGFCRKELH